MLYFFTTMCSINDIRADSILQIRLLSNLELNKWSPEYTEFEEAHHLLQVSFRIKMRLWLLDHPFLVSNNLKLGYLFYW